MSALIAKNALGKHARREMKGMVVPWTSIPKEGRCFYLAIF